MMTKSELNNVRASTFRNVCEGLMYAAIGCFALGLAGML